MKIIHCSDLHIDSKMESNLPLIKAKERRAELILTFENMVEFAKLNGVRAIIIAGDMFDTLRVSISTKNRIVSIISKNADIDFLYLAGNHDEESFISSLNEIPTNLKVFGDDWTYFEYGSVCIAGVKLSKENNSVYQTLTLSKDNINIVVLHGQIVKSNYDKGVELISLPKLMNKNIDYLALGHIHQYTTGQLDKRGAYCYSGCLEGRGFDELGDKGFVLLETDEGKVKQEFIPMSKRKLFEYRFDITGIDDFYEIEQKIIDGIAKLGTENLIKVVLVGKYNLCLQKNIISLSKKLNDIFYFAKVKDESSLKVELSDFEHDMSLKGEFIRRVLSDEKLSEDKKEQLILMGLKALDGEVL